MSDAPNDAERWACIQELRRGRPRERALGVTILAVLALASTAWWWGDLDWTDLFNERRARNLRGFLAKDLLPESLRGESFSWGGWFEWAGEVWRADGAGGAVATLAMGGLAIVLAGAVAFVLLPLASRSLMRRDPYLLGGENGRGRWDWLARGVRLLLVLMRAIPEYVLAVLFIGIFGFSAWPAVLALAVHNAGILGRLGADTLENVERAPLRAWRMLGASRTSLYTGALWPLAFPRLLLYFFYRFETCLREATIIGMIGILSLGDLVLEARAHDRQDQMVLFILFGSVMVLGADLLSQLARAWVRRSA